MMNILGQRMNDKIVQMEKQQEILLKNTNGHKVSELMGYVDKQRNIYRNNIQQLLNKLILFITEYKN